MMYDFIDGDVIIGFNATSASAGPLAGRLSATRAIIYDRGTDYSDIFYPGSVIKVPEDKLNLSQEELSSWFNNTYKMRFTPVLVKL